MIDTRPLLQMVAEIADVIDENVPNSELGTIAIVYEINDSAGEFTQICYRCSDPRRWVQTGLFEAAGRAVEEGPGEPDE